MGNVTYGKLHYDVKKLKFDEMVMMILAWYKLHYDVSKLKFDDMVMMILAWYNTHYVWIVIVIDNGTTLSRIIASTESYYHDYESYMRSRNESNTNVTPDKIRTISGEIYVEW